MATGSLDLTKLQDKLKENIADFSMIFLLLQSNGFSIKNDRLFTGFQIRDSVPLIRASSDSMVQPGRSGSTNFKGGVALANREGRLRPFKVDLKLDEKQIYAWSKTYLARKTAIDSSDIYSFPAMNWYMEQVYKQIGKDVHGAIHKGVYNPTGNSNVDITDGLDILFDRGVATSGTGFVGDIPTNNVVASAATINASNILTELKKLGNRYFDVMDEPEVEPAVLAVDPRHIVYINDALDAQLSNSSQVVARDGSGKLTLKMLPNVAIEGRSWLKTTDKQFLTLEGNLAVMGPEENTDDIPSIQIEKADRAIKIFIDGEFGVDYCDGRVLFMNDK